MCIRDRLYTELYHLTVELPRIYEMYIQPGVRQLNSQFGWILRNVQQNGFLSEAYLSQRLSDFSGDAATFVTQQAMKIPQLILIFLISVVSSIFIATDYYDFSSFLIKLLPKRHRAGVFALKDRIVVTLKSLFKAYSILLAITFSELFVGFLLLGAPNPLLLASMIALVDLLPVIGTGTVLVPMGVISLLTGNYYFGVGVLILYGIVVVVHNILEPKLISRNTGLNPVLMLAAIYLGLRFFGVFGMIALPITPVSYTHLFHAERSVIPRIGKPPVDFAAGIDITAIFA